MTDETPRPLIAVIDYGIGNLHSAAKALERAGAEVAVSADPAVIRRAAGVVLPGVGAFGACVNALDAHGLRGIALEAAHDGRPFLGVCVGMQMLFDRSEENPGVAGLGVVPGTIRWIPEGPKRPQMQWNRLALVRPDDEMFAGLDPHDAWMYFVHSFHGVPDDPADVVATIDYGGAVNAAFRRGAVFATQFHPEKSARDGLALLANFVQAAERAGASS